MGAGDERKRQARRDRRRDRASQGNSADTSAMDFDHTNQKDDERRRNTSSEDEGDEDDEDDEDNHGQLATTGPPIDPNVANLVGHASQMIGHSGADGTAMAVAAAITPSPSEALALLAASSAVANMGVESARSLAAHAVAGSDLANEGLRNSDVTYDNRFKRYDEELQRLKDRDEQLQNRVALLEGLLSRVLSMMQNGNIDAAEVAQMLRNLGI